MKNWGKIKLNKNSVPNETVFRIIGNLKLKIKNKKILDLGYGTGSNLREFHKRGGKIYGADIRKESIFKMIKEFKSLKKNFLICDFNSAFPEFKNKMDLMLCKDTYYYIKEKNRINFLINCKKNLNKNGIIILQYIQNFLVQDYNRKDFSINLNTVAKTKKYFQRGNNIKLIQTNKILGEINKAKLKIKTNLFDISTHLKNKKYISINRYIILKNE